MNEITIRFNDGRIWEKYYTKNGKKEGKYMLYSHDGQLLCNCNFMNGKYNGECLNYHSDGQLFEKCSYINNEIDGECFWYHKNGKIFEKCRFINGKLEGEYIRYNENGNIEFIEQYKNNNYIGCKDKNGKLILSIFQIEEYVFDAIIYDDVCLICKI